MTADEARQRSQRHTVTGPSPSYTNTFTGDASILLARWHGTIESAADKGLTRVLEGEVEPLPIEPSAEVRRAVLNQLAREGFNVVLIKVNGADAQAEVNW